MKKYVALFLIAVTLLTLAACGSKDALAGTWSADLGDDGVITWTFNGKGKCTMENAYMKQDGTYTIDGNTGGLERTVYLHVLRGRQQPYHEGELRLRHQRHLCQKISCTGAGANRNNEKCLRYTLTFFAGTACYFC